MREVEPNDDADTDTDTGLPTHPTGDDHSAGPDARASRGRLAVGLVLLLIGLAVSAAAIASSLGDDGKAAPNGTGGGAGTASGAQVASATVDRKSGKPTLDGSTSTTSSLVPTSKPRWPPAVAGRPKAFGGLGDPPPSSGAGLEDGLYLWNDFDGWHLWQVGGGSEDGATITADDTYAKAAGTGGSVDVTNDANLLTFSRGSASEPVVGVDFSPGFYAKTMVVTTRGELTLHLGARGKAAPRFYGMAFAP